MTFFIERYKFKIFIIYVRKPKNFRQLDLKYLSKNKSKFLFLFYRKYEDILLNKIHYKKHKNILKIKKTLKIKKNIKK